MSKCPPVVAILIAGVLGTTPALAGSFRLDKRFTLAPGDAFVLSSDVGSVSVQGVQGQQALVVVTSDRQDLGDLYDIRFEQGAGQLKVVLERKNKGLLELFQSFRGNTHIEIELPRSTPADIRTSGGSIDASELEAPLKAHSSGGSVKVAEIRGDVAVSSSGGGVDVREVRGTAHLESSGGSVTADTVQGAVWADSSGGSVNLKSVAGDIEANSGGGGVNVQGAGGHVKAGSSGGPVRVVFADGNSKGGDLDSSGGGVEAALDSRAAVEVDAISSGGSVSCNLPLAAEGRVTSDKLHGKLNGGGPLLRLRSSGGGISISAH